jgi:hypothetical protein
LVSLSAGQDGAGLAGRFFPNLVVGRWIGNCGKHQIIKIIERDFDADFDVDALSADALRWDEYQDLGHEAASCFGPRFLRQGRGCTWTRHCLFIDTLIFNIGSMAIVRSDVSGKKMGLYVCAVIGAERFFWSQE